ncbi:MULTISPECIES: GNAT family N-acetyltransferase [unclassified Streptomyces]|uniref:GNAT family N-acetyltransferase n=1 Tax=unclassified Streptomyces TaxID=2593676 RepID=UPI00225BF798|nr:MULTISPECIES: GNAT family N-acetyltransferase [unclassified Streptomyces]MCX4526627.1 GNAT family N-acetyltransferase [Streptomyces sp. NBC_01551]MCX4542810.1 GNAT family N-acetyltransferase [Streptomyces sp. NBC_01565]
MHLTLRPFRPSTDSAPLLDWIAGPAELVTWAGPAFGWPLDDAQLAAYAAEPGRHTWTAVSDTDRPLGHISLRRHPDAPGARVGRVLIAPDARGRGLGEILLTQAIDRAFGELGLTELDLGVYAHNTAAVRLYEKLGFQTQQVLRDVEQVEGVWWTALQMRLTSPNSPQ